MLVCLAYSPAMSKTNITDGKNIATLPSVDALFLTFKKPVLDPRQQLSKFYSHSLKQPSLPWPIHLGASDPKFHKICYLIDISKS